MNELKPCPFCGGHAQTDFIEGGTCRIECYQCDCHTAHLDTPEQAITAWNRRAPVERQEGWISVKDRLPPIGENAQFIIEGWRTVDDDYWIEAMNTWINGDGEAITHWRAAAPSAQGRSEG